MYRSHAIFAAAVAATFAVVSGAEAATELKVDPSKRVGVISPMIYGSNHDIDGVTFRLARRLGGNRLTGYNWEIDASNAGKDYQHQNDRWLTTTDEFWKGTPNDKPVNGPAAAVERFHRETIARGNGYSLVTVPIAGLVAADADGPVAGEGAGRFVKALPDSGDRPMSLSDGAVYADQMVRHLVARFGNAASRSGIDGYSIDNEPDLWDETHPKLHPRKATCAEVVEKSIATARAIKRADPAAETFGPASWGITGYDSLKDAADWPDIKRRSGHQFFLEHYLDAMRIASDKSGVRLLDVLDVHWYTEDPKDRKHTPAEVADAGRAMYDPTYQDPSWIGQHFSRLMPVLPRLRQMIDRYYPGTRIAISEYDWPATDTVAGGIAQADALGAFGREGVYFAAYHHRTHDKPDAYVAAAFNLYLNFDGKGSAFGEEIVESSIQSAESVAAYVSRQGQTLHVILLSREAETPSPVKITLDSGRAASVSNWMFDRSGPAVRAATAPTIAADGRSLTFTAAPMSVYHLVISVTTP